MRKWAHGERGYLSDGEFRLGTLRLLPLYMSPIIIAQIQALKRAASLGCPGQRWQGFFDHYAPSMTSQ